MQRRRAAAEPWHDGRVGAVGQEKNSSGSRSKPLQMNLARTVRSWHKWLGLVLGLQLLIWSVSGFYMVALNIDFIHGDHLVRAGSRPLAPLDGVLAIPRLVEANPELLSARLTTLPGFARPVYELT